MMCIRVMNPLVNMVGGFEAQPILGWLSGGLSSVVGWWFGGLVGGLVRVGIRIVE